MCRTDDCKPFHLSTQTLVIITIVTISIFSIAFSILGLVGAIKEHLTITCIYALLSLINLIATIANAAKRPYYWAAPVFALLTLFVALLFLRDLYLIRRKKQNRFRNQNV